MVVEQDIPTGIITLHIRGTRISLTQREANKLRDLLLHVVTPLPHYIVSGDDYGPAVGKQPHFSGRSGTAHS